MKTSKYLFGFIIIVMIALCTGSALAWDMRRQFKQEGGSNHYASGSRAIEMQEKFDHNSMNMFKGETDSSNGYTVTRNLNGNTLRGYTEKDGSDLLRDQSGNFYRANTRW